MCDQIPKVNMWVTCYNNQDTAYTGSTLKPRPQLNHIGPKIPFHKFKYLKPNLLQSAAYSITFWQVGRNITQKLGARKVSKKEINMLISASADSSATSL